MVPIGSSPDHPMRLMSVVHPTNTITSLSHLSLPFVSIHLLSSQFFMVPTQNLHLKYSTPFSILYPTKYTHLNKFHSLSKFLLYSISCTFIPATTISTLAPLSMLQYQATHTSVPPYVFPFISATTYHTFQSHTIILYITG